MELNINDLIQNGRLILYNAGLQEEESLRKIYSTVDHDELPCLFSTLHHHLNTLFDILNQKIPYTFNEPTNLAPVQKINFIHYKAEESRKLIAVIRAIEFLQKNLVGTDYEFQITPLYAQHINNCKPYLKSSGGSSIPAKIGELSIIFTSQVFLLSPSETIKKKRNGNAFTLKSIGSGSYAQVFSFKDTDYNKKFAIKRANRDLRDDELIRFRQEFETMKGLSCPFIAEVYQYNDETNEFIMEYLDSTLYDYVNKNNNKASFKVKQRINICLQLYKAFRYIHSKSILHRDISPANILIKQYDTGIIIKIADFGLVKLPESQLTTLSTEMKGKCNDPNLRFIGFSHYELSHEIYALTLVTSFILTGSLNFERIKNGELKNFVRTGTNPNKNERYKNVDEMEQALSSCHFNMDALRVE